MAGEPALGNETGEESLVFTYHTGNAYGVIWEHKPENSASVHACQYTNSATTVFRVIYSSHLQEKII